MDRVYQEFYCGERQGFIRVGIHQGLNHEFWFECPNCKHKHQRVIRNGQIFENGRFGNEPSFELTVPKSAYSKEPFTKKMKEGKNYTDRRDGALMDERWLEIANREKYG